MKGCKEAMLPEQILKSTSTTDQMKKKTPDKVGSSERVWTLKERSRRIVKAIML